MIQQYRHISNGKVYSINTMTEIVESTLTSKTEAQLLADGFTLVGNYVEPVIETPTVEYEKGVNILTVNTTDIGNIGTGEDNLIAYTLPGNTLSTDNDLIIIQAFGTFANTVLNLKTLKLYFGSVAIYNSGAFAPDFVGNWNIEATIIRTSATTQKVIVSISTDTAVFTDETKYTATTQDLATDIMIRCTGTAVANNDIVQKGLIIKYLTNDI